MKENNNIIKKISICFLMFFLGIFVTVAGIYYFKDELFKGDSSSNGICYTACQNKVTINEKGISDAVDKIYDAVVLIENYKNDKIYSTGTGFVYKVDSKNGYLLTNYHVVSGNTSLKVTLTNGKTVEAKYLGGDEYLDMAVISIAKENVIKVAEIGTSENSKLGDTLFTIGTPVDSEYIGTVTRGILSGKDRFVTVNSSNNNDSSVMKVLQTDAAINPGNSGGPLVNSNGEVIGINSLKIVEDEVEGIGFAIPIEDVMFHIENFEKGEKIIRPFIGVSMLNVTDSYYLYQYKIMLDESITSGAVVIEVTKSSPASGVLKKGDVITKINGEDIKNTAYLKYELYKYSAGDTVEITFIRDNKTKTEKIKLAENTNN